MLAQNVLSLARGSRYREGAGKGCRHRTGSRFFPRAMSFPSWSARVRPRLPSRIWRRRFLVLRTTWSPARASSSRPWNIRSTTPPSTRPARCRSPTSEEAELVKALYASLLEQRFRNKQGEEHQIGAQLAGEPPPLRPSLRRSRRHDRQVSGSGGRSGADLDGDFERRLPAAEHRVSIREEPVE